MSTRGHHGLMMAAAGGGGGGAPNVLSLTPSAFNSAATSHHVDMPSSVSVGDLLIAIVGSDGSNANSVVSTPAGWTQIHTTFNSSTSNRGTDFYRIADGTEGGTTVDFATAAADELAAIVIRIAAGSYSGTPEGAIQVTSSSINPAAPTATPSWGADENLWITNLYRGRAPPTGFPLPDNRTTVNAMVDSSNGTSIGVCTDIQNVSSLSPGNWTAPTNTENVGSTLAVRPA